MAKLEITGLAQETDFSDPTKTSTVLIINRGALRVRIDESAVQELLRYALERDDDLDVDLTPPPNGHRETGEPAEPPPDDDEEGVTDEAGIAQI